MASRSRSAPRSTFLAAAGLACATSGCATSLATLQPAETLAPGHVQVSGALAVNVPASRIVSLVSEANTQTQAFANDPTYVPSEDDRRRLLSAAVGLALSSPGVNPDIMLRYGVVKDLDMGIRWSGLAAHADAKIRFLGGDGEDGGMQGAVSLGVSKALYSGLVFDVLERLDVNDYSRWNLEVPVLFGKRLGDVGHVWFGPKYVASRYSVDASLQDFGVVPTTTGWIHHFGAFAGAGIGYKSVFLFGELTVAKMWAEPTIFGQKVDLGGIVVVPAGGLMIRI